MFKIKSSDIEDIEAYVKIGLSYGGKILILDVHTVANYVRQRRVKMYIIEFIGDVIFSGELDDVKLFLTEI